MTRTAHDVAIAGLGPAGRALAHRCLARGLSVVAVDPHPERVWTPTYAAWSDELPDWLPDVARSWMRPSVFTTREHPIDREYQVLDNAALHRALDISGARIVAGRVDHLGELDARTVIDARGVPAQPGLAQQTAYGIVVEPPADPTPWFMDWRRDNGTKAGDAPSFLYAMPLGAGRMLLEETCLVGRPALGLDVLRVRLEQRLRSRGIEVAAADRVERVRFPVESPRSPAGFGARGGLLHPGTGYGVAAALATADSVAAALAAGRSVRRALWPARARIVHRLRLIGLHALLELEPDQVAPFFAAFFALPVERQRAYLSGRTDPVATAAAMTALFGAVSPDLRRLLARQMLPIRPR